MQRVGLRIRSLLIPNVSRALFPAAMRRRRRLLGMFLYGIRTVVLWERSVLNKVEIKAFLIIALWTSVLMPEFIQRVF